MKVPPVSTPRRAKGERGGERPESTRLATSRRAGEPRAGNSAFRSEWPPRPPYPLRRHLVAMDLLVSLQRADLCGPLALLGSAELAWRVVLSYLLGAVPFGFVLSRWIKGVDLREVGSGNIGATNAMRVLGKPLGVLAFALDFGKGCAPVALLGAGDVETQVLCGAAAVCGHVWPVYLRFKGGKAVATGYGAIVAIDPWIAVGAGLVWLVGLLATGFVSVASIAMGLAFPLVAWWRGQPAAVILGTGALTLLILVRHRSNMKKLLAGTESRTRFGVRLRGGSQGEAS